MPLIHQMHWTYLLTKGRYRFVTSDNPVAYTDPAHDPQSPYGVGLAHPNVEVTFPITQELALFAGWKDWEKLYRRATDATVKALNIRTILMLKDSSTRLFKTKGSPSECGSIRAAHQRANFKPFVPKAPIFSF